MSTQTDTRTEEQAEFISLMAGGQGYCIEVTRVREIRRWSPVTTLPHAPDCLLGVMNLRGAVIPVLDLALRLGLERTVLTARHVVLIVSAGDRTIGLLVDSVSDILRVPRGSIQGTPSLSGADIRLVQGMIAINGEALRVLNMQAVAPTMSEVAT